MTRTVLFKTNFKDTVIMLACLLSIVHAFYSKYTNYVGMFQHSIAKTPIMLACPCTL